ncbi:uncharacterized protein LOC123529673 [Mercenaria mercenaria]|uniref:uncharacterized protein LOC123529673 n=1 Tax=Mercenaria mercenaria TaxID=6596 RepID=UPI00234F111E|nr:uncharacterized protein LOC123529673 [Mercenaria mercenaria]
MVKCLGRWGKHDLKQSSGSHTVVTCSSAVEGNVSNRQHTDINDEDEEETEELEICCLSGCLTTIAVGILFFLALPTGILLCVFASSNKDAEVLVVGIVLAVIPIILLPLIAVILYNRRRIRRLRKRKVSSSPENRGANRTRY